MRSTLPLLSVLLALLAGCARTFPTPPKGGIRPTEAAFDLPAPRLYELSKQAVQSPPMSLSTEDQGAGVLLTSWQEHPGTLHVARRWQERTRYRIAVAPHFDNPAGRSTLSVSETTEQRKSDKQEWQPAFDLHRPERAQQTLEAVSARVRASAPTTAP